jgi:predicted nuclease with TOPRIM domain
MRPKLKEECEECKNLRSESIRRHSEYAAIRDELAMISKRDPKYSEKASDFKAATGRLREAHKREDAHKDCEHSSSN